MPCAKRSNYIKAQTCQHKLTAGGDRLHGKARWEAQGSLVDFVKCWLYSVLRKLGECDIIAGPGIRLWPYTEIVASCC